MSGATQVVFIGGLVAIFLLIVAALMWQESNARSTGSQFVYVLEDAVDFVLDKVGGDVLARLARSDVLRILEWEVFYLQGLAQPDRHEPIETVAGGWGDAIDYLTRQIADQHGVIYDSADVAAVLTIEGEYLASIGAVGDEVVDRRGNQTP